MTAIKKIMADRKSHFGDLGYTRLRTYLELLETALTNILIIDERIFHEVSERRAELEKHLFTHLFLQNVIVAKISDTGELESFRVPDVIGSDAPLVAQTVALDRTSEELPGLLPAHFSQNVHFLIIHQTIIDSKLGRNLHGFLDKLAAYKPAWVVVTSGRGKPEERRLPEYAKFLDFSNLRKYTVERPDKVLLTQMLFSLKEG
jgi:hypothetical protein